MNRFLKHLVDKTEARYDTSWKFKPTFLHHMSQVVEGILSQGITHDTIPVASDVLTTRYDLARDILTPFGITVMPFDAHDTNGFVDVTTDKLKEYHLPVYSYEEIIENVITEIRNREAYEKGTSQ